MTEGPNRLILEKCTPGDVAMVAGFSMARRLEERIRVGASIGDYVSAAVLFLVTLGGGALVLLTWLAPRA